MWWDMLSAHKKEKKTFISFKHFPIAVAVRICFVRDVVGGVEGWECSEDIGSIGKYKKDLLQRWS